MMKLDNIEKTVVSVIGVIALVTLALVGYSIYKGVGQTDNGKK